jgi:hypothetical protein
MARQTCPFSVTAIMAEERDINQAGGWLFAVATPGHPPLRRHFKVYEPDQVKARELVRQHAKLGLAEHCEPVKVLSAHEFAGMRPGEVKRHG